MPFNASFVKLLATVNQKGALFGWRIEQNSSVDI